MALWPASIGRWPPQVQWRIGSSLNWEFQTLYVKIYVATTGHRNSYRYDFEATSEVSVTDCEGHIYILYIQTLSDLGVKICCLAIRLGNYCTSKQCVPFILRSALHNVVTRLYVSCTSRGDMWRPRHTGEWAACPGRHHIWCHGNILVQRRVCPCWWEGAAMWIGWTMVSTSTSVWS